MQLGYLNPTHTLIVAHLDAGETLGSLEGGEHGATHYIKVDGTDPNYVALLEKDPMLESVIDPGEVRMPPAAEAPAPAPAPEEHAKPAAPAAHAAPAKPAPAGVAGAPHKAK